MARKKSLPTELEMAATMAQYAEIEDVYMEGCSALVLVPREEWEDEQEFKVDGKTAVSTEVEYDDEENIIWVTADCEMMFVKDAHKLLTKKKVLSIKATFKLVYGYQFEDGPKGDELDHYVFAFGEINGSLHVWPYFREFVQSITTRMGLPPYILPMYRIEEDQ